MKSLVTLSKILLLTLLIVLGTTFFVRFYSSAGTLAATYVYLSRIQANLNGTAGQTVELVLAIDTAQNIPTAGSITIEFPDADDAGWCRTAGTLTVAGVASSTADLASTNWDIDSALPTSGTLSASCAQGTGAGSVDKITITSVGALTSGTTYGVKITNNVGIIGTHGTAGEHELNISAFQGTTIDSKTFKISLIADDSVIVSATVSDVPSVSCSISAVTVALGTLYPGGSYATGSHTIGTSSSGAAQGYYWAAYGTGNGTDAGLYKSDAATYLLASGPTDTLDLAAAGAEGFGITLTDPDTTGPAVVTANFITGTPGTFGTLDDGVAGAKLILYQNGAQGSVESSTVTYGARASSAAPAGTYQEIVTFVCGGYF